MSSRVAFGNNTCPPCAAAQIREGSVDPATHVTVSTDHGLPAVDSHSHTDNRALRPLLAREAALGGLRRAHSSASAREDEEERVALRVDLVAPGLLEHRPEQPLMLEQHLAVVVAELLQQAGHPSMSVKRKVTVPLGSSAIARRSYRLCRN
jgi:hypothetical protein